MQSLGMPKLGATMEQGLITRWYKHEGDKVREGEFLLEVLTKKATFKIQSPVTGVVFKILAPADTSVAVGLPLAVLAEEGDEPAALQEEAAGAAKALTGREKLSTGSYACPIESRQP